ncbi:hypothetical protein BDY24DRAFT_341496 [Mrakia frigida]|uniref:uncharacterized protein n=1 Tax=Mrakia frigida TaxID=29902 RepID=UPI003FCC152E
MLGFSRALGLAGDEEEPEDDADDETNTLPRLARAPPGCYRGTAKPARQEVQQASWEVQSVREGSRTFTDQVEGEKFETIQEHFQVSSTLLPPNSHQLLITFSTVFPLFSSPRVDPHIFESLCHLLRDHPKFKRKTGPDGKFLPRRPPASIEKQLSVFLIFAAAHTHLDTSETAATGEGSTYNYVNNVVGALLSLKEQHIRMPVTLEERKKVSDGFGWPGALGAIDGVLFPLKEQPGEDGIYYYCRKKFYGVSLSLLLAIVDAAGRFLSLEGGWTAAVTDVTVLKSSHIWKTRQLYF